MRLKVGEVLLCPLAERCCLPRAGQGAPTGGGGHRAARGSVQRDLLWDAAGKQSSEEFAPSPAPCRGSSRAGGRALCQRSPCTTADPDEEPALALAPVKHMEQLRGQHRILGHG